VAGSRQVSNLFFPRFLWDGCEFEALSIQERLRQGEVVRTVLGLRRKIKPVKSVTDFSDSRGHNRPERPLDLQFVRREGVRVNEPVEVNGDPIWERDR